MLISKEGRCNDCLTANSSSSPLPALPFNPPPPFLLRFHSSSFLPSPRIHSTPSLALNSLCHSLQLQLATHSCLSLALLHSCSLARPLALHLSTSTRFTVGPTSGHRDEMQCF
ncbi:hypothetical protein TcWFU_010409 [Taenia crassiceps]|uniref:Uncharacterized protein n=1 Tax=Taenia crassiceps TaxID=6207 RepID=A0ABR4Q6Q5_9CEST